MIIIDQKLNSSRTLNGSLSFFSYTFAFSPKLKLILLANILILTNLDGLEGVCLLSPNISNEEIEDGADG